MTNAAYPYYVLPDDEQHDQMVESLFVQLDMQRQAFEKMFEERLVGFWKWPAERRATEVYMPNMPIFVVRTSLAEWLTAYRRPSVQEAYLEKHVAPYLDYLRAQEPPPVQPTGDVRIDTEAATLRFQNMQVWQSIFERIKEGALLLGDLLGGPLTEYGPYWRQMYQFDPPETLRMLREINRMIDAEEQKTPVEPEPLAPNPDATYA